MRRSIASALRIASAKTDRNPSDAAKSAGNYVKGKFTWHGETIAIENPKGSVRSGVDKDGKTWKVTLPSAYGYLHGAHAIDGDNVDCYVGPDHDSDKVWIVDQVDAKTKKYDEPKCLLSFGSKAAALADYEKAFSDGKGKDRIGAVTEMSIPEFRAWLDSKKTKQPLGSDIKRAAGGAIPFPGDVPGYASGGSPGIDAIILAAAQKYGIDPAIMRAFAGIESGYDPMAVKGKYRGLYQMSGDEFGKYGGTGNIFDPQANADAAAQKFQADIAAFNKQYGRDPTAGELYERHQQGVGGAGAHWARPDAPAWQNMYSTLEGRQKGAGWARQAISGNMLPEWKKQYDPNTITSGQFTQLWNDRVNKFAGLPGMTSPVESGFGGASAPKDAQPVGLTNVAPIAGDMSTPRTYPGDTLKSPAKTNTSGSWLSSLFGGSSAPEPESKSADWVEGPLGLMPKWGDDPTALQRFASGGAPGYPGDDPNFLSMLKNNPHGWGNSAPLPVWQREPLDFQGSISNTADRPTDQIEAPISESLSPTMGAYGAGQAAGETINALRDQDWGKAAEFGLPLAAMAVAPGMPKGVRGVPRELNEAGFYSPSLEAAKGLPQESGTLQQMRSMLLNAGAKPKELDAVGFDQAFPDPAAKVSRGQIEEFLRGNRVGLGQENYGTPPEQARLDAESNRLFGDDWASLKEYHQRDVLDSLGIEHWDDLREPSFESYSTPGGIPGSYREVVTTLPENFDRAKLRDIEAQHNALLDRPYTDVLEDGRTVRQTLDDLARQKSVLGENHEATNYTSSHWPGVTNPLLHYRTKDFDTGTKVAPSPSTGDYLSNLNKRMTDPNQKVRVLDELQSDWAQRARDQGTRGTPAELQAAVESARARVKADQNAIKTLTGESDWTAAHQKLRNMRMAGDDEAIRLNDAHEQSYNTALDAINKRDAKSGVPSAPFISNTSDWVDLGLKQVLSDAVKDPSVSRLAWAPGGVQADRYNMAKAVKQLSYDPEKQVLEYITPDGDYRILGGMTKPEALPGIVGKEMAEKLLAQPITRRPIKGASRGAGTYGHHLDLDPGTTIGGEGHKGFYGDFTPEGSYTPGIVGTRLLKILKGMDPDAKIERHDLPNNEVRGPLLNKMDAAIKSAVPDLHPQQSRQVANQIARIIETDGVNALGDYDPPNAAFGLDYPKAWAAGVKAAQEHGGFVQHYPSVQITPRMREAIRKGLPLFLALGAAGMGEKGSEDDDRFQEWLDKGQ